MAGPTIIAVDWSGAKARSAQRAAIRAAIVRAGELVALTGDRTRDETIDSVIAHPGPLLVGLDFSFGFPAWFAHERGCTTIDDAWTLATDDGDALLAPTPPFWRERCDVPVERRFRRCEERLRRAGFPAKSVFQCVGNGQVGPGSVRGMPLLTRLRAAGFAIWPFDAPAERTVFEIYPTAMRAELRPDMPLPEFATNDERDAAISAYAMWEHREVLAALPVATDPVTLIEGDVWLS